MNIVRAAEIEWTQYGSQRGGNSQYKPLFRGEDGARDNFEFTMARLVGDGNFSPRHHHNFEQFRFGLNGDINFSPGQDVPQGALGYFPEGAWYGPQRIAVGTELLLLQFGGPCGDGFMSYEETRRGSAELAEVGTFNRGSFRYTDDSGVTRSKDGFEAVWEHVNGRTIEYPAPRYDEPVVIHPDAFGWRSLEDGPGVWFKLLGRFSELEIEASMVRLEPGGAHRFEPQPRIRLLFVLEGSVTIDDELCGAHTAMKLDKHERSPAFTGQDDAKVLVLGLPVFPDEG